MDISYNRMIFQLLFASFLPFKGFPESSHFCRGQVASPMKGAQQTFVKMHGPKPIIAPFQKAWARNGRGK